MAIKCISNKNLSGEDKNGKIIIKEFISWEFTRYKEDKVIK